MISIQPQRLNGLMIAATRSAEPFTSSPDGLAQFQASQTQAWGRIIKAAGIEPE